MVRSNSTSDVDLYQSELPPPQKGQCHDFVSSQPARKHKSQQSAVSFSFDPLAIRSLPKRLSLFRAQTVAKANAWFLHAFDTTDIRCQVSTQHTGISCLIRETAHSTQAQIDSSGESWRDSR